MTITHFHQKSHTFDQKCGHLPVRYANRTQKKHACKHKFQGCPMYISVSSRQDWFSLLGGLRMEYSSYCMLCLSFLHSVIFLTLVNCRVTIQAQETICHLTMKQKNKTKNSRTPKREVWREDSNLKFWHLRISVVTSLLDWAQQQSGFIETYRTFFTC